MTKPNQAIEVVLEVEGSNDLLLNGINNLQHASYELSAAIYDKNITDDNLVQNVIGLGPDRKFFYTITCFRDNKSSFYESGIGYAYEKNGSIYFNRTLPLYCGKTLDSKTPISRYSGYVFHKGSTNILCSSVPDHFAYMFLDSNCIISSVASLAPIILEVKQHSFLARVNDNDLANVPFDSKAFSEIVAESLTKYNKQLSLKASKLNANKLSVKQLQLEPTSDLNVKKGTFIYDEESDTVKFFNGIRWRTLAWVEDEE